MEPRWRVIKMVFLYRDGWDIFNIPYYLNRFLPERKVRLLLDKYQYTDHGLEVILTRKRFKHQKMEVIDKVIYIFGR